MAHEESVETRALYVEVAPFIREAIGDAARPRGSLEFTTDLGHLPGESSLLSGIIGIIRFVREGIHWPRRVIASNPPVFRGRFGTKHNVIVSDPDYLLQIFRNEDAAWSTAIGWRGTFDGIDAEGRDMHGPLFADFEAHRDVRKILAPAFSQAAMARYLDVAYPMFEGAIDDWMRRRVVDAKPEVRSLLASLAGRIFVGITDKREQAELDRWTKDIWGGVLVLAKNPYLDPNWRKARRGYAAMMARLESLIADRRVRPSDDLLGRIAAAESTGGDLDDDHARASIALNIMLAAFDTTSSGLASMVYLLAKHPEWQERLRAEALELGRRPISFDETRSLVLADRVWKETLRLFPVAGAPPRVSLRDVVFGGARVPAGSLVAPLINALLFDERFWTEPDRFDPDRFSPERAEDKSHRAAYLPFGAGAHTCIGMQLANAEARAFVHALLVRARIRLEKDYTGTHRYEPLGAVSGNVRIVLEPLVDLPDLPRR